MKRAIAFLLLLALCLSLCACGEQGVNADAEEYEKALELLEDGELEDAAEILDELGDYEDSEELLEKIERYEEALDLLENDELEEAYLAFRELGDFADAKQVLEGFQFVLLEKSTYDNGELSEIREYVYDSSRLAMERITNPSYKGFAYVHYTYDSEGNLTKEHIGTDGKVFLTEKFKYDENGKVVYESSMYSNQNYTPTYNIYSYDEAGNLVRSETYSLYAQNSSTPTHVSTYTYDEHNEVVRHLVTYAGGQKTEYVYQNTYDSAGRKISQVSDVSEITYEYDESGNLIFESNHFTKWDSWNDQEYIYDIYGNVIEQTFTSRTKNGTGTSTYYFEYDILYTGEQ